MKRIRPMILRQASIAMAIALFAMGLHAKQQPAAADQLLAQGAPDCYAVGQQVAAQQGGTLAGATAETRGGQTVCRIVVLVPARDGERPRRAEFVVPAR